VAAPPGKAAAIGRAAKAGWAAALAGPAQVTVTDPTTTAPGALIVLGLSAHHSTAPGAAAELVGLFIRLQADTLPSAAAGVTSLQARPASAPAFVTSEQDVYLANRGKPAPVVTAVYPSGATSMLDFPMVRVAPAGSDPLVTAAMAQFERQLTTDAARAQFAADGLRDPSGAPLTVDSTGGTSPQPVTPAPATITPSQQATALRLWSAAAKPSQLLAAIDVSGSMRDNSGNGKSKIQVVTAAAAAAMTLVPDDWALGLWTFSQHDPPKTDWTELVPLGPVKTQRRMLTGAVATLPTRVPGNTGLYDTVLAAFQDVSAHYDPASVNVVALLTDGADVDPDSIGLTTLLSRLRAGYDPSQPVHIFTLGFGADADASALKRISQATHGQSYIVKDPKDILGVLLDSIIANNT
jgi:Ca-activated chloride channel homolog